MPWVQKHDLQLARDPHNGSICYMVAGPFPALTMIDRWNFGEWAKEKGYAYLSAPQGGVQVFTDEKGSTLYWQLDETVQETIREFTPTLVNRDKEWFRTVQVTVDWWVSMISHHSLGAPSTGNALADVALSDGRSKLELLDGPTITVFRSQLTAKLWEQVRKVPTPEEVYLAVDREPVGVLAQVVKDARINPLYLLPKSQSWSYPHAVDVSSGHGGKIIRLDTGPSVVICLTLQDGKKCWGPFQRISIDHQGLHADGKLLLRSVPPDWITKEGQEGRDLGVQGGGWMLRADFPLKGS